MLPATARRVMEHTRPEINQKIAKRTEANVANHISVAPALINARLAQLDREWDIERILETNGSVLILVGLILGLTANWSWLLLSFVVAALLLLHALQGWCPPVPLLRRLGIRTEAEINQERYALKVLRRDFAGLPKPEADPETQVLEILRAVRK